MLWMSNCRGLMIEMVILLDNQDSFVYNLYQYLGELGAEPLVFRSNRITLQEIINLNPSYLIVSPGPCTPLEAGVSNEAILHFAGKIPILGVCLGHQCIGHVFGGQVVRAHRPVHGKTSVVKHLSVGVLRDIPTPLLVTRYHSLVISTEQLPDCLEPFAWSEDGEIMAVRNRLYSECPVEGVQFHPEAIKTEHGHQILANFLEYRPVLDK